MQQCGSLLAVTLSDRGAAIEYDHEVVDLAVVHVTMCAARYGYTATVATALAYAPNNQPQHFILFVCAKSGGGESEACTASVRAALDDAARGAVAAGVRARSRAR